MTKPILKIELIDGLQVIRCHKEDLDWDDGKALSISIADFRGQKNDPLRTVLFIEWFDGKLQVRMYNGGEDPVRPAEVSNSLNNMAMVIKPDPVLTKAIYCPITELPRLLSSEDEAVQEIVEQRLKQSRKNDKLLLSKSTPTHSTRPKKPTTTKTRLPNKYGRQVCSRTEMERG